MNRFFTASAFKFGTKSETLRNLEPLLTLSSVPRSHSISVGELRASEPAILEQLTTMFAGFSVAVRSSAVGEDGEHSGMAGAYESMLNVDGGDRQSLFEAIRQVVDAYPAGWTNCDPKHQVLVQEMVADVSMSGVVFTQDLNAGAPYYVINYDDESGRTDTVTSGGAYSSRTLYMLRSSLDMLRSPRFQALLTAVREIEEITEQNELDVEFALDDEGRVSVLQVRRITTHPTWNRGIELRVNDAISDMTAFIAPRFRPLEGVFGERSLFGQMPDWNPVEIIGW